MLFFKPYSGIKDFLYRWTIIKIGNLHIRLHKIVNKDMTTLYHNHPFNYISIILFGGYTEKCIINDKKFLFNHKFLSIIKRKHNDYHQIVNIKGKYVITLFIAYGKYSWNAINMNDDKTNDGIYQRKINEKIVWCKKENGIWYIGNIDEKIAKNETRHSIHQCINKL